MNRRRAAMEVQFEDMGKMMTLLGKMSSNEMRKEV